MKYPPLLLSGKPHPRRDVIKLVKSPNNGCSTTDTTRALQTNQIQTTCFEMVGWGHFQTIISPDIYLYRPIQYAIANLIQGLVLQEKTRATHRLCFTSIPILARHDEHHVMRKTTYYWTASVWTREGWVT